jgi:transposase
MPAKRVPMRKIKELLRLKFNGGLSHRQIVAALGVSLGAVSKIVSRAESEGLTWSLIADLDESEIETRLFPKATLAKRPRAQPDGSLIHRELRRPGVTLQLLWEEYVEAHGAEASYRYTQFCQLYRDYAGQLKRSMRQEHRAGEKLFADYAGQTLPILDPAGGPASAAHIFVAVLGASNYTYACATAAESTAGWIGGLVGALTYFGGVTELIVPDNPKALIFDANRYEPRPNRTALDFAAHYDTVILPARPRKPQDKAKVEVGVQIVERWILARLRHRRFYSLHEVNVAVAELLEDLNRRPFKKLSGNRREWFERLDQPALKPLPVLRYQVAVFKRCRVNIDYHIDIDGHYYSVPHALARQEVEARLCCGTVEVLHHGKRVASHARSSQRGAHTTVAEHMPAAHRAHLEWTPGRFLNWGASIGVAVAQVVRHLLTHRPHPEMGYRACLGLLALAKQYGNERLEAACTRALAIGAPSRKSVASILKAGLDKHAAPDAKQLELNLPEHTNVRGPGYYH